MPADKERILIFSRVCVCIYLSEHKEEALSLTLHFCLKILFRFLLIRMCVLSDDYLTVDFLPFFLVFSSEIESRGGWIYSTYMNKKEQKKRMNEWMNDVIEEVIQQIFLLITSYACFLYSDADDDLTNWLLSAWTIQGQCSFRFIIGKVTSMKR